MDANRRPIIVADGGSTKCEWAVRHSDGTVSRHETAGVNPAQMTSAQICSAWVDLATVLGAEAPASLYYYGAGCLPGAPSEAMREALKSLTGAELVEVESDMVGAARALLGREAGVACILGTGANSCLYDGEKIVENVRPLGFILGDEGSGADIGKHIVADALKGLWPKDLTDKFWAFAATDYANMIARIYREPRPSAYLATFARFAAENSDRTEVRTIVTERMTAFLTRNVMQYPSAMVDKGVGFVGGVARQFCKELREACQRNGIKISRIEERPLDGMMRHHGIA